MYDQGVERNPERGPDVRRKPWNGSRPANAEAARRRLLDAARTAVERHGEARAGLADVARIAGVTRQTVYRYFEDSDDLFRSAAALASGGFLEQLRAEVRRRPTWRGRVVECLVFTVTRLPEDPHLGPLVRAQGVDPSFLLGLGFVQEELVALADEGPVPAPAHLDALAELLIRLLGSFLTDPGPPRDADALRALVDGWLTPHLEPPVR